MSRYGCVLALDSAMNGCGAAVLSGGRTVSRMMSMERGQAEQIIPMVEACMAAHGVSYAALEAVAVTVGPGAFTGLRIGLSSAKSFGLSLDIPVYGITTLQALALAHMRRVASPCTVLVESKRTDFYVQGFDGTAHALYDPQALSAENVQRLLPAGGVLIGDAVPRFLTLSDGGVDGAVIQAGYDMPDVAVMVEHLAEPDSRALYFSTDLAPVYLRPPDVSVSQRVQRVLGG